MIDLPSLIIAAGLVLGLLAGDAAIYGDTLRVQIAVPQTLSNAGFDEASAEAVFMAEAARVVRGESIISPPSVRVHTAPSLITALAKPLSLGDVVTAMQNQLGIDHLMVTAAILAESASKTPVPDPVRPLTPGTKLDMVIVVVQPKETPMQTVLEQPDGDVTTLVKRGADWAMEHVSPYRVVLAHFLAGVQGDAKEFDEARQAASRFLNATWDPVRASERALTHNVLALMDLIDNKAAEAESQLLQGNAVPDVMSQGRALLLVNRFFLALIQNRADEAIGLLAESRKEAAKLELPGFHPHLDIQEALLAWATGNTDAAERLLRTVVGEVPNCETGHHYLALLLRTKGDAKGAAAEEQAERNSHGFEVRTQGLAVLLVWADPVNGGFTRRI